MPPLNEGDDPLHADRRARHVDHRSDEDPADPGPDAHASSPRWRRVFGKAGRAETPTDPAPLSMFETVGQAQAAGRNGGPA